MGRIGTRTLKGMLAIVAGALLLAGCGGDGGGDGSGDGGGDGGDRAGGGVVEQVIGPAGGTVTSGDGRLMLTFPEGALPADNTIVIETLDADNPLAPFSTAEDVDAAYDLRPNGMTFDEPVTATFDIGEDPTADDGATRFRPSVLVTQGDDGQPEALADIVNDVDPATGQTRVSGDLAHFSPLLSTAVPGFTATVDGVPDTLGTEENFTTAVNLTVDFAQTIDELFAVDDVTYVDESNLPLQLMVDEPDVDPTTESVEIPGNGFEFDTALTYGCTQPGDGGFIAAIELAGLVISNNLSGFADTTADIRLLIPARSVTCVAGTTGGDDDDGSDGEDGDTVQTDIGPDGGSLTSSDGRLTVMIPEGALDDDTPITIETVDPAELPPPFAQSTVNFAYDLRPDGLTFDPRAKVIFDVGRDPLAADDAISLLVTLLATAGTNGQAALLQNLQINTDPGTGLSRVTGELGSFSPLVPIQDEAEGASLIINSVPDTLTVGETFTAQAILAPGSQFGLDGATYEDTSELPLAIQGPAQRPFMVDDDAPAFVTEATYGCNVAGDAVYSVDIPVEVDRFEGEGVTIEEEFEVEFDPSKPVTCTAPDDDGGGGDEEPNDMVSLANAPGPLVWLPDGSSFDNTPGDDVRIGVVYRSEDIGSTTFDVYNGGLQLRASYEVSGSYTLAGAALEITDDSQIKDGLVVGGTSGAKLFYQLRGSIGDMLESQELVARFTDNVPDVEVAQGPGENPLISAISFESGLVQQFGYSPIDGKYVIGADFTVNTEDTNGDDFFNVDVPTSGFAEPGKSFAALTSDGNTGSLFTFTAEGSPGDITIVSERQDNVSGVVGGLPVAFKCAGSDSNGNSICAITNNDGSGALVEYRLLSNPGFTILEEFDAGVRGVQPDLMRDGDTVMFSLPDRTTDSYVIGTVQGGTVAHQRKDAPAECDGPTRAILGPATGQDMGLLFLGCDESEKLVRVDIDYAID